MLIAQRPARRKLWIPWSQRQGRMRLIHLALIALLGSALTAVGCGDDGSIGTAGTGGAGGAGGMGGAGAGGSGSDDPCFGHTACIVCTNDALPPAIQPFSHDGLRTPVDFTATPDGAVVQGGTVSIEVAAEIVISLPLMAEAAVTQGSTSTYIATAGGDGTLDIVIPEQMVAGEELVIDGGSGGANFTVGNDATELVIGLNSILLNLAIASPLEIDLPLDASETGGCTIEGEGVTIPVEVAR